MPAEIGQLVNLQKLDLARNQLTVLPAEIGQLVNLQSLDLADNHLSVLPPEVGQLVNLQSLDLAGNHLSVLPPEIGQLVNLQSLELAVNQLSVLPPEIGQLVNLWHLDLAGNQLSVLPAEIGQLVNLQSLDLARNQLTVLPAEIGQLVNLWYLQLTANQLGALPPEIGQLVNLRHLDLVDNHLSVLPPEIGQLANLGALHLLDNQLGVLPPEIGQLVNLWHLQLTANQLGALPPEIGQLVNLQVLDLAGNQLSVLPAELAELTSLQTLKLAANQLEPELAEAASSGIDELRKYLHRLALEGEPLYEAKLLLVGEGKVGKSSLLGALRRDPWVDKRDSTHGLEIKELRLRHPHRDVEMTLQGWDFGGQPVYRSTHQLFFSAPAVYLVVWTPREGPELNFVEYWIRLIRHRAGPDARVIVVATHRSERRVARLDETALRSSYGKMIAGFHHVDSHTREGIPELTEAIANEGAAVPGMGRFFPRSWRKARERLNAAGVPYLSYSDFEATVAQAGLDQDAAVSFARNSHKVGRLIHYSQDRTLAELVVLRPDWLSRAISYVLEDETTANHNRGLITHQRLAELWDDPGRPSDDRYPPPLHASLLRLMEQFDLSYRVETGAGAAGPAATSLVAQLVPSSAAFDGAWDADAGGSNELVEVIEVVEADTRNLAPPEGLIFQLIVRLHRFSLGRDDYRKAVHWSGGVILDDGYHGRALLTVSGGRVQVIVRAAYPQFFMGYLTREVRWLVESFWKGLDTVAKVPCRPPCPTPGRGLFDVDVLQLTRGAGITKIICLSCKNVELIEPLLLGIVRDETPPGSQEEQLRALIREVHAVREDGRELRTDMSQGFQALLTRIDQLFFDYLRTLEDEAEKGPRLFTLVPVDATWRQPGWVKQRFRLTLFCEHSRAPVSALSKDPQAGVYEIELARDWVRKVAPVARMAARVLSVALPAAKAIAEIDLGAEQWEKIDAEVNGAKNTLSGLVDTTAGGLEDVLFGGAVEFAAIPDSADKSGAALRQLHVLLQERDPSFGGLVKVHNKREEPIWVHPLYHSAYVHPPPVVPPPRHH